jgi:hypothetical protein
MRARPTVRLLFACNNRCVFCAQVGLDEVQSGVEGALEAARQTSDEVTFVGGEPTLDPHLGAHVSMARGMGFRRIGLQTNGAALAAGAYTASLVAAGLTDVHLSIHGATADVHDYHAGVPGRWAEAVQAARAARSNGLAVVVTTVVTRSNFRSLSHLPPLLSSLGVVGWLASVPLVAGRAWSAFDRVVPRLALALPFVLGALDAADAMGTSVWVTGAPQCLLGPYARWSLPAEPRAYGAPCKTCEARQACPGVDPEYLERFRGDELRPVHRPAAPDGLRRQDIARMFVGAGEVARHPLSPRPAARPSLPLLNRPQPALGEVRSGARRSGDALREILPALFDAGHRTED